MNQLLKGGQQWGERLVSHRKIMQAEMRKNLRRLAYLAEERHVQYKQEFIADRRARIDANHAKMAEEKKEIKRIRAEKKQSMFLLDMGLEKARKAQAEAKTERQRLAKLKREKMDVINTKARREWLVEMNDKCMMWNKSPEELKYAQFRLFDKTIMTKLPRKANYVLDRHADIESLVEEIDANGKVVDYSAKLAELKAELKAAGQDVDSINRLNMPQADAMGEEGDDLTAADSVSDAQDVFADEISTPKFDEDGQEIESVTDGLVLNNQEDLLAEEMDNMNLLDDDFTVTEEDGVAAAATADDTIADEKVAPLTADQEAAVSAKAAQMSDAEMQELEAEFLAHLKTLPTTNSINILERELADRFTTVRNQEERSIVTEMLAKDDTAATLASVINDPIENTITVITGSEKDVDNDDKKN
eukprot:gene13071-15373_t